MDAVNLLPLDYRTRSKKRAAPAGNLDSRRTLRTGGLGALALVVLLGALYGYERSVVSSKKSALAKDQAALAAIKPEAELIKQARASAAARLTVISSVTSSRMNWDRALGDFARIVPTDSFLTSLAFDAPVQTASVLGPVPSTVSASTVTAATTPAAPVASGVSTLTVSGTAPGTVAVARVLDRLALIPWLSGVTLGSASRSGDGASSFNVTATVSQEP